MITPFDLHVLSTPPAFILSQDQTLLKYFDPDQNKLGFFYPEDALHPPVVNSVGIYYSLFRRNLLQFISVCLFGRIVLILL